MRAMKAKVSAILDESGAEVVCAVRGCNEMPANAAFGVLCREHIERVNSHFRSWREFMRREEENARDA